MQLPETETGSPSPYWEMEEHTVSVSIPQLAGTVLSRNPGIPDELKSHPFLVHFSVGFLFKNE